jgi:phosphohistidine phosphatase
VETIEEVAEAYGALNPVYDRRLYLASATTLLDIVRNAPESAGRLLLVGHNPGLEELALRLTGGGGDTLRRQVEIKYPTATVAEIELPAEHWPEARDGSGRIIRFIRPRDLDPELGPDEDSY